MLKSRLNIAWFRQFIPMIEEETKEYVKRWGDSGEIGQFRRRSLTTNKHFTAVLCDEVPTILIVDYLTIPGGCTFHAIHNM